VINDKTISGSSTASGKRDQQGWAVSAGNANWGWLRVITQKERHAPVLSLPESSTASTILELSAADALDGGPVVR